MQIMDSAKSAVVSFLGVDNATFAGHIAELVWDSDANSTIEITFVK
jgi:hypothetical protein